MKALNRVLLVFSILMLVVVLLAAFYWGYPYIFSRRIVGEVTGVTNLTENLAVLSGVGDPGNSRGPSPTSKIFSFAVAIRDRHTKEIVTGSSEDRQWGVVKEGQCADAEFFPYPPWNLQKAGTYHGVRLHRLYDNCENVPQK